MPTVLHFATTTPPIPVTVDIFETRNVKSDVSSAFRDDLRLPTMRDTLRQSRTLGRHKRNDLASPPGPLGPNLQTGTLLRSIWEKKDKVFQNLSRGSGAFAESCQRMQEVFFSRWLHEGHGVSGEVLGRGGS